jgi:hypothetical protein
MSQCHTYPSKNFLFALQGAMAGEIADEHCVSIANVSFVQAEAKS